MEVDYRVADRCGGTGRLASPYDPYKSTATPGTWGDLHTEQRGGWDMPATPRMSGGLAASRHYEARDRLPAADVSAYSTPRARATGVDSDDENARARPSGVKTVSGSFIRSNWAAPPHRRGLKRQDAVLGGNETDDRSDGADTWEQCGLSGNKTATKGDDWTASVNNCEPSNVTQDSWCYRPDGPADATAGRSNWNWSAVKHELDHLGQDPGCTRGYLNDNWGATKQNIQPFIPVVPVDHKLTLQPSGHTGTNFSSVHGGNPGVPDRKPISRTNPDNYDGNRAAADGSRVFYSAILPTVPTLLDIANHAEYTAWFDMLKSVLKYHQLTPVVAADANRPHVPTAARRWDQDRLRAAIIIKGALSFDVFERVRQNGWRDTEDPTGTIEKVRETHAAVCPCGNSQGMTLLDF